MLHGKKQPVDNKDKVRINTSDQDQITKKGSRSHQPPSKSWHKPGVKKRHSQFRTVSV